jgi:hypothetical protein
MLVVLPPSTEPSAAHPAEGARFGRLAETLLRKHGWISVRTGPLADAAREFAIAPRGTDLPAGVAGVAEGPLSERVLGRFGIGARAGRATEMAILTPDGEYLGRVVWPALDVRVIPATRGVVSEPYPFRSADERWNAEAFPWQELEPSASFRPVLLGQPIERGEGVRPDAAVPIALSDGETLLLGAPLLELSLVAAAFPPLDAGYWAHTRCGQTLGIEAWIADVIGTMVLASGRSGVRVRRWPEGFDAALTIRHDYDRLIPAATRDALIATYAELGARSSWGFLIDKAPRADAERLEAAGHEVMLHSVAGSPERLRAEIESLHASTGCRALGCTSHGGLGAPGYLGGHHFGWGQACGFSYAELLGRPIGLPMPAITLDDAGPVALEVILPSPHHSLDLNTKPEGHALASLRSSVPAALARGEHVVVMNHPDIHLAELFELLRGLPRGLPGGRIWHVTYRDLVAWVRAAKFNARAVAQPSGGFASLHFGAPIEEPTVVEVIADRMRRSLVAPRGARSVALNHSVAST